MLPSPRSFSHFPQGSPTELCSSLMSYFILAMCTLAVFPARLCECALLFLVSSVESSTGLCTSWSTNTCRIELLSGSELSQDDVESY